MALMTNIYVGTLGLKSSQNAINITAHNLANVNTDGYVRQQPGFNDLRYQTVGRVPGVGTWQVGLGVESDKTRHIRDIFLDASYRREVSKEGFYSSQYDAIEEMEIIFGELEEEQFQQTLLKFKEAMNEVSKTPESLPARAGLVMYAEEFINRANAAYDQLLTYQQDLNVKVSDIVYRINELGDQIEYLNDRIRGYEATGIETAGDLRDQRDKALDELASLVDITYEENEEQAVTVKIEGTEFVTRAGVFHLGTAELDGAKGSTYLSVVWPHLSNKELYYFEQDVSTEYGNDSGKLKGVLMARGDYVATYKDMPQEGAEDYAEQLRHYHDNVEYSLIMKTQATFDRMINGIVEAVNNILCPQKDIELTQDTTFTLQDGSTITYAAGSKIKVLDMDKTSYGDDKDKTVGTELFTRKDAERYTKVTDANGEEYYLFNETNEFGTESLYTLGNIEINRVVLDDYAFLPLTTKEGDADYNKALELYDIWNIDFNNLNPDNLTPKTFEEFYTAFTGEVANVGKLYLEIATNQNTAVANVDDSRWSLYGVSSEEELTNLIRYQNAYNANARYITTVSTMLEHIISTLGA